MAAFKPTPQQKRAISSRARTVVVSAGAGSGKTAVLSERIVSRLCEDRADIDRFLVVTYTNAAAFEMRSRIADKLSERISQNLHDYALCEHLRRQVGKLSSAKVQTVHAFCLDLVKRNASALNLPAHFNIGDESALQQLRQTAIDNTLDSAYASPPEGFLQLRQSLCEERGDKKLAAAILSVFDRLQSLPYPESWLMQQIEQPSGDLIAREDAFTECELMITETYNAVLNVQAELNTSYADIAQCSSACHSYLCTFAQELTELLHGRDINLCLDKISSYKTVNIRAPKDAPEHALSFAKGVRDTFKDTLSDIKKLLSLPDGGQDTYAAEKCLCALVLSFGQNLKEEKLRAELLDFNDLEHYTVKLLSDENGEKTALSEELSQYLCELMVDEYQDSNKVQDTIFSLVAPKNGSSFFVGDIKQSIYRFRKADPRIFAQKCKDAQSSPDSEYIAMDTNFRSRAEVLSLCNYFFERAMTESFGDVNYSAPGQGLTPGRKTEGCLPSELCLLDTPSIKGLCEGDESVSTAQAEAEYVASRIKDMLLSGACTVEENGKHRPARPSDFAVLLSSYSGKAPIYQKALEAQGLDSNAEIQDEDPFCTVEASIIISLLRIISNHRQDIPLISVLRSPFFGFSADDLAFVRSLHPDGDLWDAVLFGARQGDQKCLFFKSELEHLCNLAKDMSCSGLLQYIYARYGAYGVFSALGRQSRRKATLDELYQTALSCEKGSFAHISKLVDHIDRSVKAKTSATGAEDGVKIMSIHKSKGLEFPFVFVCDLCKAFNTDDVKTDVLLHTGIGLSLRQAQAIRRVRFATKKRFMISRRILHELRAEELRKLYVAMTRAREKLFLVISSGRSSIESLVSKTFEASGEYPTEYFMSRQSSCAKWLIAALMGHPCAELLRSYLPSLHYPDKERDHTLICSDVRYIKEPDGSLSPLLSATEESNCGFDPTEYLPLSQKEYAYSHISALPSKITPSGAHALVSGKSSGVYFASDSQTDGLSAAEKGTRVHALLAKTALRDNMSAREAAAQFENDECDAEDALMVAEFLSSALGRQAISARECLREYQFSVLLTPQELGLGDIDDEFILLNGSIDMLLFTQNGIIIADFKTDSVKPGFEDQAAQKHRAQLEIYEKAAQKIFGQPVIKKSVFFLKTGVEAVL